MVESGYLTDGAGSPVYFKFTTGGPIGHPEDLNLYELYADALGGIKIDSIKYKVKYDEGEIEELELEPKTVYFDTGSAVVNDSWFKTGDGCYDLGGGKATSTDDKAISHVAFVLEEPGECPAGNPSEYISWDGNYNIDQDDHYLTFTLDTENGFEQISVEPSSDNIALTDVMKPDGTSISSDLDYQNQLTGSVRNGWETIVYTGSEALTSVKVQATPLDSTGSRFMFQVSDQCDFSLQVDPELQLIASTRSNLEGSYPNPFHGETTIRFKMSEAGSVRLSVYDLMGRRVQTLVKGEHGVGMHEARWDGTDASGAHVASGVYIYRLQAGSRTQTQKVVVMR